MSLGGGDALARGAKSANFAGAASISQFEDDLIFRPEIVAEKYGLTQEEIEQYQALRNAGEKVPDLPLKEDNLGFEVTDKRHSYLDTRLQEAEPIVSEETPKYPEKQYANFKPILDRVLVKRISLDKECEVLSDGSLRNKRTGFVIPAKYRQHNNTGVVLAIGGFVVIGGVKTPLSEVVNPGDIVSFGEYNVEKMILPDDQVLALCDAIQFNYVAEEEDLNLVRVQDIRSVRKPIAEVSNE